MSLSLLVGLGVFVAVLLVGTLLYWSARTRQESERHHIHETLGTGHLDPGLVRRVSPPVPTLRWLDHALRRAGHDESALRWAMLMLALGAGAGLLGFALLGARGLVLGFLGVTPYLWLLRVGQLRLIALTEQLPDALDLMGRTMRAGHAFSDALRTVAGEIPPPIGLEFARVSEQHRLGMDLRDCLSELVARNPDSFDLRLLAGTIMLQREVGGTFIEMLDHIADTVRERLLFQSKVEALTAEVRLSAIILSSLPFVIGLVLLLIRPAYLSPLIHTPLGRILLMGGLGSLLVGTLVMRALARVEMA